MPQKKIEVKSTRHLYIGGDRHEQIWMGLHRLWEHCENYG